MGSRTLSQAGLVIGLDPSLGRHSGGPSGIEVMMVLPLGLGPFVLQSEYNEGARRKCPKEKLADADSDHGALDHLAPAGSGTCGYRRTWTAAVGLPARTTVGRMWAWAKSVGTLARF